MNYRTKIPIPYYDEIVPTGTPVLLVKDEFRILEKNGTVSHIFKKSLVESNPDIFEPERTWTDVVFESMGSV